MSQILKHGQLILMAAMVILITGCDEDERVAQVATQAADRQAQQNTEMARLNRDVTAMQHAVHKQQANVNQQRDNLETERRQVAGERLTESRLGPILKSCAAAVVCIVTLGFCWSLLLGLRREDTTDQTLNDLLVSELVSDKPVFLPSLAEQKPATRQELPFVDQDPSRLLPSD